MSIMIDKNGIEWKIVDIDNYGHIMVERKKPEHWICGIFCDGGVHVVEEDCQFDTSAPRKLTATRRYGWIDIDEED